MIRVNENIEPIIPYKPGKPIEEVQKELGLKNIIKLASNENNLGISTKIQSALAAKLKDLYLYPDGAATELRNKIATKTNLSADNIILGNGSDEILQLIALAYLNAEDEVLISEGTFSEYNFAAQLTNTKVIKVPLKNDTYSLPDFETKITSKTKVIFLCNPNNPTGTYFNESSLKFFLRAVPQNTLVVIDEAYYEYVEASDYPDSLSFLDKYPNIIILRTFSKIYALAALRIGYGIASKEIITALNKARQPFNANRLAQEAAILALDDQDHLKKSFQNNQEGKKYFYQELDKLNLEYLRTEANFVFIKLPVSGQILFDKFLKKGIIVRPMAGFGFPNAIRVTIGLPQENEQFFKEFKEILSEI